LLPAGGSAVVEGSQQWRSEGSVNAALSREVSADGASIARDAAIDQGRAHVELQTAHSDVSPGLQQEGNIGQESDRRGEEVRFSQPLVTSVSEPGDSLQAESKSAISKLESAQQSILALCTELCERSIAIHREDYAHDLVEPYTLAIALMQRARVAERLLDGVGAMEFAEQAESAAVRALGGGSQLAIGIMLEVSIVWPFSVRNSCVLACAKVQRAFSTLARTYIMTTVVFY
jgi:hypothetical protein